MALFLCLINHVLPESKMMSNRGRKMVGRLMKQIIEAADF
jgi:hypothetical protein